MDWFLLNSIFSSRFDKNDVTVAVILKYSIYSKKHSEIFFKINNKISYTLSSRRIKGYLGEKKSSTMISACIYLTPLTQPVYNIR